MSKLIQQIAVGAGILCTGMSALAANTPEKGKSDNQPKQPNILVIFGRIITENKAVLPVVLHSLPVSPRSVPDLPK